MRSLRSIITAKYKYDVWILLIMTIIDNNINDINNLTCSKYADDMCCNNNHSHKDLVLIFLIEEEIKKYASIVQYHMQ